jgi:hypothetical protein
VTQLRPSSSAWTLLSLATLAAAAAIAGLLIWGRSDWRGALSVVVGLGLSAALFKLAERTREKREGPN